MNNDFIFAIINNIYIYMISCYSNNPRNYQHLFIIIKAIFFFIDILILKYIFINKLWKKIFIIKTFDSFSLRYIWMIICEYLYILHLFDHKKILIIEFINFIYIILWFWIRNIFQSWNLFNSFHEIESNLRSSL